MIITNELAIKVDKSRKNLKERKNRTKKIHGINKTKVGDASKKKKLWVFSINSSRRVFIYYWFLGMELHVRLFVGWIIIYTRLSILIIVLQITRISLLSKLL